MYKEKFTSVETLGFSSAAVSLFLGFTTIGIFEMGKWVVLAGVAAYLMGRRIRSQLASGYLKMVAVVVIVCVGSVMHSADWWRSAQLAFAIVMIFSVTVLLIGRSMAINPRREHTPNYWTAKLDNLAWGYVLVVGLFFLPGIIFLGLGMNNPPLLKSALYTGLEEGWSVRYSGILGNPNQIGICAAVLVPVVFAKALERPKSRKVCWLLLIVVGFSVWHSGSRNGLLSSAIGCGSVVVLAGYGNRKIRALIVVASLALVIALYSSVLIEYLSRDKNKTEIVFEDAGQNRIERWEAAIKSIEKRPVLGQGLGIGGVPKNGYVKPRGVDTGYPLHNSYLQITQELGVVGLLVVLVSVFFAVFKSLRSNKWIRQNPKFRHTYAGFAGVVLAGVFSAMFESWLIAPGNLATLPFWCAVGVVSVVSVGSKTQVAKPKKKRGA